MGSFTHYLWISSQVSHIQHIKSGTTQHTRNSPEMGEMLAWLFFLCLFLFRNKRIPWIGLLHRADICARCCCCVVFFFNTIGHVDPLFTNRSRYLFIFLFFAAFTSSAAAAPQTSQQTLDDGFGRFDFQHRNFHWFFFFSSRAFTSAAV